MAETNGFWATLFEGYRLNPSMIFFTIWGLQLVLSFSLGAILSFRLNPKFDPKLKNYVRKYTDYVPSLTDRFLRTGQYANWVANKEFFGRNRPEVQAIDFREGLSRGTVILCWVYTVNGWGAMAEMFVAGILIWCGFL